MAKQGNYVTLPGGGVNWAEGLSKSLADLSASFSRKASEEEKRALLAREFADNKDRYEKEQAYRASRDALADRHAAADRAYRLSRDQVLDTRYADQTAEETRRWNIGEARKANEDRLKAAELEAERKANQSSWDIATDPAKQVYSLEDYSAPLQRSFTDLTSRIEKEQASTREFLQGDSNDAQAAVAAYRDNLTASGLPKGKIDELVAQRESDLHSFKDELTFGDYTDEQANSKVNELLDARYTKRLAEIKDKISSGAGLTKEEKVQASLGDMPEDIRGYIGLGEAKKKLSEAVTGPSAESLLAQEQARVDQANNALLKNIELYDDYIGRANSGGKSYSSDSKGVASALESMGKLDIGWKDTDNAKKGFKLLLDKGIDPEIAAASIAFGVDTNLIGSSFPSIDSADFAKIQQQAELLQKGKRTDRGRVYIDRSVYSYNPLQARALDELQKGLVRFTPGDNSRLPISREFDISYQPDVPIRIPTFQGPPMAPSTQEQTPAGKVKTNIPSANDVTSLEDLSGYSFPSFTYGKGDKNPTGGGVDALKAELGDALDLKWGYSKRHRSEREVLSKEVLEAYNDARKAYDLLRANEERLKDTNIDPNIAKEQLLKRYMPTLQKRLAKLDKLKVELLNLK